MEDKVTYLSEAKDLGPHIKDLLDVHVSLTARVSHLAMLKHTQMNKYKKARGLWAIEFESVVSEVWKIKFIPDEIVDNVFLDQEMRVMLHKRISVCIPKRGFVLVTLVKDGESYTQNYNWNGKVVPVKL